MRDASEIMTIVGSVMMNRMRCGDEGTTNSHLLMTTSQPGNRHADLVASLADACLFIGKM